MSTILLTGATTGVGLALGGVDVLINNAGVAYRSVVEHVSERERLQQMGINFRAPMELTRLVLPYMRSRRAGRIINVSSMGGMMAMPTMAVYSASKFALEGATESLYYEVKPWGEDYGASKPASTGPRHSRRLPLRHAAPLPAAAALSLDLVPESTRTVGVGEPMAAKPTSANSCSDYSSA